MATLLIMALQEESQGLFEANNFNPYYCGIGQVKAAFLTHSLILQKKPSRVVNLGSAGSHKWPQGTLLECTSFIQRITDSAHPIRGKTITTPAVTELATGICGSADFVELGAGLNTCDVMDMEAYAMAYVCQQLNVPFTCIKYVTDSSNLNTLNDWKQNLSAGAEKLLESYQKIISREKGLHETLK